MDLAWEPGNDKQTLYVVFFIKTRHKSVPCDYGKITQKEITKLFLDEYLTSRWNVEKGLSIDIEASIKSRKKWLILITMGNI